MIQEQLKKQSQRNRELERETERYVTETVFSQELAQAKERDQDGGIRSLADNSKPERASAAQQAAAVTEAASLHKNSLEASGLG